MPTYKDNLRKALICLPFLRLIKKNTRNYEIIINNTKKE